MKLQRPEKNATFTLLSQNTNYEYTLQVYVPAAEPPVEGFPIIYVLDGLSYFEFAKYSIKLQSKNTLKTEIEPTIVVGIGHQEQTMRERRFYDFTAPAEEYLYPEHAKGRQIDFGENGGAVQFYQFIEEELKPLIEASYAVNTNNQTIYGHSLAGYYSLWCMLTHPESFTKFIAISPSIWWNGKELSTYLKNSQPSNVHKLFMAVGEKEGFMVKDAQAFANELTIDPSRKCLQIAKGENHASVVPTTMSQAFRFINS